MSAHWVIRKSHPQTDALGRKKSEEHLPQPLESFAAPLQKPTQNSKHTIATPDSEPKYRKTTRFYLEVATFAVVAAYTTIAALQWNASNEQAQTAKKQLALSERPWISYTATLDSPLFFDDNGANLIMRFKVHNSGLTPATSVYTYVRFNQPANDRGAVENDKKTTCDVAMGLMETSQQTLFPSTDDVQVRKFRLSPEDLKLATKNGTIETEITSCVAYRSTLDDKPSYTSEGQIYSINRKSNDESYPFSTKFMPGVDVPLSDLTLDIDGEVGTIVGRGDYHSKNGDKFLIVGKETKVYLPDSIHPGRTQQDVHK
jgi:hypothetical protein